MAWPVTARLIDYIANVTPITAAQLNSFQDRIWKLIGGSRSVLKIRVDGTGDVDASADIAGSANLNSAAGDTNPAIVTTAAVTTRKEIWRFKVGTYHAVILKEDDRWMLTVNAYWDGAAWQYVSGAAASRFVIHRGNAGTPMLRFDYFAGATGWADGAWVGQLLYTRATDFISAVTIRTTAGNISAEGDPASDQARLKGKQFVTAGAIGTGTKGVAMNNGGGDGSVVVSGNDIKGRLVVTTGAAVAASGVMTVVSFGKAYPNAPEVIITPSNSFSADLATQPYVSASTISDFTITVSATALTPATVYGWNFHIIG